MKVPALALNLPGHGHSAWREDADYTPTRMAEQLAEVLNPLLTHPVIFVGHSLGGQAAIVHVPWFWSDQYDVKLQCAGLNTGYDEIVVRGDITVGSQFTVFYLKDGRVCAVDSVGRPAEYAAGKALIAGAAPADRQALADPSIPLRASRRSRETSGGDR